MKNAAELWAAPDAVGDKATIDTLVIGWGNEWRGDDAVGRLAAQALAVWAGPAVRVMDVRQLTPELACAVSEVRRVLFIDACPVAGGADVRCERLVCEPSTAATGMTGHMGSPRQLVQAAQAWYGATPEAWLLAIPGIEWGAIEGISPIAQTGLERALEEAKQWLANAEAYHDTSM